VTEVVIIGAGPYGLATAGELRARGVPFRIFGVAMETWLRRMPEGMLLRSEGFASSIGAASAVPSLERFCAQRGLRYEHIGYPLPRAVFAEYGRWAQERVAPALTETRVASLRSSRGRFEVELATGERLSARSVVVATGFVDHRFLPDQLQGLGPRVTHTADHADLGVFAGREVAVVGAGQSALETAALLLEQGARPLLVGRTSQVVWLEPPDGHAQSGLERMLRPHTGLGYGWRVAAAEKLPHMFRLLPEERRLRFAFGTLPPAGAWWLRPRVEGKVPMLLGHRLVAAQADDDRVRLTLGGSGGEQLLEVDHVIAGTGYRYDLGRLPWLDPTLAERVQRIGRAPALSSWFESSVPGLYFVGFAATSLFGPSMRFVCGSGQAAARVARSVRARAADSRLQHRPGQALRRRRVEDDDLLVLCYHGVSDGWVSNLAVRPAALEVQLRHLAEQGYRAVTFTELVTQRPSGRVVAVTFDDGYQSVLDNALPIFDALGMRGTVFVPTGPLEADGRAVWEGMERWLVPSQEQHLRLLSWDGVRALAAAGWEIGSHTHSHRRLRGLSDEDLDGELRGSKLLIEQRLQQPCRSVAYPFGSPGIDLDLTAALAAGVAGYEAGGTVPRRLWPPDPLLWPRVSIGAADSLATFRAKVSTRARLLRTSSAWSLLDAPRRTLRDGVLAAVVERRIAALARTPPFVAGGAGAALDRQGKLGAHAESSNGSERSAGGSHG
jgi:cation diffusion facilitator CzcD-associated flavoprotein CzcO/peptidoglycan/xylan/chitin deacetylase (PgdA/CDA1 family)